MASARGGAYEVSLPELRAHADAVDRVAVQVDAGRSAARSVQLGAGAYGVLCQMIPALIGPVQSSGADALGEAAGSLNGMADSVRAAVTGYQRADDAAAVAYRQVDQG